MPGPENPHHTHYLPVVYRCVSLCVELLVQTCSDEFSEIIPCLDQSIHKKLGLHPITKRMEHYERHCPTDDLRLHCLVPPPKGYQVSPQSWV